MNKLHISDPDITRIFEFAKELTLEAGKVVKHGFEETKDVQFKAAAWIDPVTTCDRNVENMIIGALLKEFPDHKIIAEEASAVKDKMPELTDDPTWIIDPIDGTANFIHQFPFSCISIGLTINKVVVLAIIYNPMNSELYTARKGHGAFLNGERIHTSKVTELNKSLIMIEPLSARQGIKNRDINAGRIEALTNVSGGLRSMGSAALAFAYIARGSIDCYHMEHLQPWDVAAGLLLVTEAGGTVIDTKGGPYNIMKPCTIAASNESVARELVKLIVDTDLKSQRKRLQRS